MIDTCFWAAGFAFAGFSTQSGAEIGSTHSVALVVFFDFFRFVRPRAHGVHPLGLNFGWFLVPFWCQVGAMLGHLGAGACTGWAGGVTRSVKNWANFNEAANAVLMIPDRRPCEAHVYPWISMDINT